MRMPCTLKLKGARKGPRATNEGSGAMKGDRVAECLGRGGRSGHLISLKRGG